MWVSMIAEKYQFFEDICGRWDVKHQNDDFDTWTSCSKRVKHPPEIREFHQKQVRYPISVFIVGRNKSFGNGLPIVDILFYQFHFLKKRIEGCTSCFESGALPVR